MYDKIHTAQFLNCVELSLIPEDKTLAFFLPTAEDAKMLALLLRRCLHSIDITIDVKYNTPFGMVSAQKDGPERRTMSPEKFQYMLDTRTKKASGRLTVSVKRDDSYGGDVELLLYFYSKLDTLISFNLMKLGLLRTYTTFMLEQNEQRLGAWTECEPEVFCSQSIASRWNNLTQAQQDLVTPKILEVIKAVEDDDGRIH